MPGKVWKDGTRRGIAYVEGRDVAQRVLEVAGRVSLPEKSRPKGRADERLEGTMAVYVDRRGRPFAWQIPFDIGHWDRIAALIGTE